MEPRWDPTGAVITNVLRLDDDLMTALLNRPKAVSGGEVRVDAPTVTVVNLTVSPTPFGPGSRRIGLAEWRYAIRCRGRRIDTGDIEAMEIAGHVVRILGYGSWVKKVVGSQTYAIAQSLEQQTTGPIPDPDTQEPTAVVLVNLKAGAQALG
jgi:hypothetical protein